MSHHKTETSTKYKLVIKEKYIQIYLQNRKPKLPIPSTRRYLVCWPVPLNLSYFLKLTVWRFYIIFLNPHFGFYHENDRFRTPARHAQGWSHLHQKGSGVFGEKKDSQVQVNSSREQEQGGEGKLQEGVGEGRRGMPLGASPPPVVFPPVAERPLNTSAIHQRTSPLQEQGVQTVEIFYIKKL